MKKGRISISFVSIISLVLLVSILFCCLGFIYYDRQKEVALSELRYNLATTTKQLSKGLSIAVWDFDQEQAISILESGLLDKNIKEIIIEYKDRNKTAISITRNGLKHYNISKEKILPPPNGLEFESNISYLNEQIGTITVFGTPEWVYSKLKKEVISIALFILFLTILIIVGVYYVFYLIVIKPLKFFEQFSQSVNLENYNSREISEKKFFKELDQLSSSLQKMVCSINSNYKKLESSERKFKEMANLLPQPVLECDLKGNLTFMNERGLSLFGITKTDIEKGVSIKNLLVQDEHEKQEVNRLSVLEGEKFVGGNEYLARKADGTSFPVVVYSSAIMEDGKPIGVRSIGIDISLRKKNEAAIKELERLNYLKEKESEKIRTVSLIEGQEEERLRISREIHDGIGQMMTAIKLGMESIEPKFNSSDSEKFEYTKNLLYEVIDELRHVSSDLSPTFLYEYGIYPAANQLIKNISKIDPIKIHLNSNIQNERYLSLVEITLYRIIQEAINNTLKYSKANTIEINLTQDAEFLELTIEDDGIGFDMEAQSKRAQKGGNGLKNMASRANLIGANFKISSTLKKGVQISLQIPLENTNVDPNFSKS